MGRVGRIHREMLAIASRLGVDVTVVDTARSILERTYGPEVAICGDGELAVSYLYVAMTITDPGHPYTPSILQQRAGWFKTHCLHIVRRVVTRRLGVSISHVPRVVDILRLFGERRDVVRRVEEVVKRYRIPLGKPTVVAAGLVYVVRRLSGEAVSANEIANRYGVTLVSVLSFYKRFLGLNTKKVALKLSLFYDTDS
jgi:transcription initiation factor TFIIIB Brf1 subunit/transcription initiation factor TFIIB